MPVQTFNDYQFSAKQTAFYPKEIGITYCALALVGEAGEVANKVKKVLRDEGGKFTHEKKKELAEELGDVLWYLSQLATELSVTLSSVAFNSIEKVKARKENNTLQGSGDQR